MAEPTDTILPMLRDMRSETITEIRGLAHEVRAGFTKLDARTDRLEQRFDNIREAVNGESVLGRYAAAEVEERLSTIEKRLATLEEHS